MPTEQINEHTRITKMDKKGYWLWDELRGMNLSMRASSKEAALIDALEYYQGRLTEVEAEHKVLKSHVDKFLSNFE